MSDVKAIRVFISSPGDVAEERRRAALVLGRLKRDFARFFDLSPELWEYEPMLAAGSFQDVIVEPAATDIVVLILWSRLGTPLPPQTALRAYRGLDGRTPVTGTEWEFENALNAARERQARAETVTPDILVYKKDVDGVARGKTSAELDEAVQQMAALERFWQRYFRNPEGQFTLAFNSFTSLDSFEQQFEAHLRALLQQRIERDEVKPATWPGDPYLGLMSFDYEHANIFFGRTAPIQEISEALIKRAENAKAFILVAGASGCGKSSLVKAGVVPSLTEHGVVLDTRLWRRCTFRPAGTGRIADRLAAALVVKPALPELAALGVTAEKLSAELSQGEILSLRYGLVEAARQAGNAPDGSPPMGRLILVVDQLEELFTDADIAQAEREWFVDLLIKLAASGFVWIVATMRSDFFAQMAAVPRLRDLCSGDGLYHLLPPRSEEVDQMIRLPADAAGISFEVDPRTGIGLDQELRTAASSNPHSLPLLEFTLDELYRRDILGRGGRMLRTATYRDELKRLEGAIAARAEAEADKFSAQVRNETLPEILRSLVAIGDNDKPVARSPLLSELATTPDRRAVLDALIAARLLVVHGGERAPTVSVAHESLMTEWPFYSELIAKYVTFLRARGHVAAQAALWTVENKDPSRLLARGLALEEGRSLLARRGELGADLVDFIETSIDAVEKAERRRRRVLIALASAATVAAVVFAGLADFARRASLRAQSNYEAATTVLSTLIEAVPANVEPVAPVQTVTALLNDAQKAIASFPETDGATPTIRRYRAEISLALAEIALDLGHYKETRDLAGQAEAALSAIVASAPGDLASQYQHARGLHFVGATYHQLQDDSGLARSDYEQAISILNDLIRDHGSDPDAWSWHLALADVHQDLGDLLLDRLHDSADAKAQFDMAIAERQDIEKAGLGGATVDQEVSWTINKLGDVLLRTGNTSDAIADFEQARDRIAGLGKHLQDNKLWPHHLAIIYNNLGTLMRDAGRYGDAVDQFNNAIPLTVALTNRDPDNAELRSVLGWTYDNAGQGWLLWAKSDNESRGDRLGHARDMLGKARDVRVTLADMKLLWQQDLAYTDASIAAADGIGMEIDGRLSEAGQHYAAAADLNQQVAGATQRDDAIARTIMFDEWAAAAFMNAGAPDQARGRLTHALDIAKGHHGMAGDSEMTAKIAELQGLLNVTQK